MMFGRYGVHGQGFEGTGWVVGSLAAVMGIRFLGCWVVAYIRFLTLHLLESDRCWFSILPTMPQPSIREPSTLDVNSEA